LQLVHTIYSPAGPGLHPAILALHGRGANALDLLGLAPYISGGRFVVICPQGPLQFPAGGAAAGYAWYPMSGGGRPPDAEAMLSARENLRTFLDECLGRYPIDAGKLVLLGFSQGGVMAYHLALREPERFVALAALSCWLPPDAVPRSSGSPALRELPVLVQHGSADSMIEVDRARDAVERLRGLGIALTYREYDMGHEITPRSLSDLSAWLDDKVPQRRPDRD
jgi:phospholipase/carboxylesterase